MMLTKVILLSSIVTLGTFVTGVFAVRSDGNVENIENDGTRKVLASSTTTDNTNNSANAVSPRADVPRAILAPSHHTLFRSRREPNSQRKAKRSSNRALKKSGKDSSKESSSTISRSSSDGNGESPEFVYIQAQDEVYLSTVATQFGERSSSRVGKPLSGSLGCTSSGFCNGPYGSHTLIGEGDARSDPGDDPTLEVIIAGAATADSYFPNLALEQAAAPAAFYFLCPNAEFEVSDWEILECQCTGATRGTCTEADFTFLSEGVFTVSFTGASCASGFNARLFIECTD
ncbi:hypothetical protein ACA910_008894 [Epithemia clementina (nom. ined.)]